jgi:hypothetical protein
MDLFTIFWLVLCTPATIVYAAQAFHWPPARRERIALDFAAPRHLVLDPVAGPLAERLLIAGRRGRFVAWMALASLGLGVFALVPSTRLLGLSVMAIAAFVVPHSGAALGAALALRRAAVPASGSDAGDRFAHLPAPSLTDYLPPLTRWWSVVVLGLATVGVGACLALGATPAPGGRPVLLVGWAAAAVAVAVTELVVRVLVRTARTATTPAALAVSDEVTGDLAAVVLGMAMGPALLLVYVTDALVPSFPYLAPLVLLLAGAPYVEDKQRRRRVRERLWAAEPPPSAAGAAAS